MEQASKAMVQASNLGVFFFLISTQLSFLTIAVLYKKSYTHLTFRVDALSACMYAYCMHV